MRQNDPTVWGVGINDADYPVGQGKCPIYSIWLAMMQRCYSPKRLKMNPTYQGCSVHPAWHRFSDFKSWVEQQAWQGKVLDKDILVAGNKQYGPDTCLFVTQAVNSLLNTQPNKNRAGALGVRKYAEGRYRVSIRKSRKHQHVGVFSSEAAAAQAYRTAKAAWILEVASKESDPRVQNALSRAAIRVREGL